jgi:integration host factor subunit alpha
MTPWDHPVRQTVSRQELIERLHSSGWSKREARTMVRAIVGGVTDALAKGDDVKIARFGVFEWKDRAPTVGRNFRTGQSVDIPARHMLTFRGSDKLTRVLTDTLAPEPR